jgi:hypothetical protein
VTRAGAFADFEVNRLGVTSFVRSAKAFCFRQGTVPRDFVRDMSETDDTIVLLD